MIKKGIVSEDKKLHDSAWELLFGKGERHSNIVWMRMQFLAETWQKADGKGKEDLMVMTMDEYLTEDIARKMDDFTDADGQQYHQYRVLTVGCPQKETSSSDRSTCASQSGPAVRRRYCLLYDPVLESSAGNLPRRPQDRRRPATARGKHT